MRKCPQRVLSGLGSCQVKVSWQKNISHQAVIRCPYDKGSGCKNSRNWLLFSQLCYLERTAIAASDCPKKSLKLLLKRSRWCNCGQWVLAVAHFFLSPFLFLSLSHSLSPSLSFFLCNLILSFFYSLNFFHM